jgi:hypothetical protein
MIANGFPYHVNIISLNIIIKYCIVRVSELSDTQIRFIYGTTDYTTLLEEEWSRHIFSAASTNKALKDESNDFDTIGKWFLWFPELSRS